MIDKVEHSAYQLMKAGDYEGDVRLLQSIENIDSEYALLTLGWIYHFGKYGAKNSELAAFYYRKASDLGCGAGAFELGRLLYEKGDFIEARQAFAKGTESGSIQCIAWHGLMMAKGKGGTINLEEGISSLKIAASQGQLVAKMALYEIELESTHSLPRRFVIYCKIIFLAFITIIESLRNPWSERAYR